MFSSVLICFLSSFGYVCMYVCMVWYGMVWYVMVWYGMVCNVMQCNAMQCNVMYVCMYVIYVCVL